MVVLTVHELGDWPAGEVRATWGPPSHRLPPEAQELVESAWACATARPGMKLFDGPMCRMESWAVREGRLDVVLSRTSYKAFFGTNLCHPELADRFGRGVLANPVGVSPALETADGFLLMGRRNGSVAYYPNRVHPFAGCLEPGDAGENNDAAAPDLFAAVRRELSEELSLGEADVADVRCTGVVEDVALRQPEVIFRVKSARKRAGIERQVADDEHHASVAVRATPEGLAPLLRDPLVTPVGLASLLLWGRVVFGDDWFRREAREAGVCVGKR
jgi:8-oxo-dGTP pyrophosphatase MutT (NUDIX family)